MDRAWKKAVLGAVILVAVVGVVDAFANLPILTGCGFYGVCE